MKRGLVVVMAVWAGQAVAEVPGSAEPGFVQALTVWLKADEAQAMPALAGLANAGNTAAQLALGMIDSTPVLQGDWLMAEKRADRIALLRPAGGLSGGSWLRVAAASDPVAAGWLALWDGDATARVVVEFAVLNEPRAARVAALALAARQVHGFAEVAGDPAYPAELRGFGLHETGTGADGLDPGDPQRQVLGTQPLPAALAVWLAANPEGDPLAAFCAANCPDEAPTACLPAAFAAVGGYHGLMRMGSPFEALVTSTTYNRSPQGLQTSLRRMQQHQMALGVKVVPEGSACLAGILK